MSEEKYSLDQLRLDRSETEGPRSKRWIWGLVVLLVVLIAAGGFWFARGRTVPVRTQVVRGSSSAGGSRTVLNASGYVVARRQATVSAKITGKVTEVLVEEGMKVEEGQLLARLDDSNVKASLGVAQAEFAAAKAVLDETRARLAAAEKELRRAGTLTAEKIASASDLDRAEAEVKALQAHLDLQQVQISVAEKQVALWQQQLEDTVVRAPFSGIAISKNAQPGEMISPISAGGGFTRTGIGTIVDMNSLEIEVDVNENSLSRVQSGQPVEATLDAYPDWKIPCKVLTIIPTADRQKATVKVRVAFNKLDPRMLPDMGVRVAFKGEAATGSAAGAGAAVPKLAVRKDGGRDVVWVVREGRLERRAVTVGSTGENDVNVLTGVAAGEKVVVEGPTNLVEGARVREAAK
jgi:RND family efflux transporter MFP subunit